MKAAALALALALVCGACGRGEIPRGEMVRAGHTTGTTPLQPTTTLAPTTTQPAPSTTTTTEPVAYEAEAAAEPAPEPPDPAPSGQSGVASWYGEDLRGSGTACPPYAPFDPDALTFAHKSLPCGTVVEFCAELGCVSAVLTDRGPFTAGRDFDLSAAAFAAIASPGRGVATVTWRQA